MAIDEDGPTDAHEAILRMLDIEVPVERGPDNVILSPKCLGKSLGYGKNYMSKTLSELAEYDLVEKRERGYYTITWRGKAYLEGDLDASTLEPDDS